MTDRTALGYAQLAAKRLGLTQEEIDKLTNHMDHLMDEVSQEEAEEVYRTEW